MMVHKSEIVLIHAARRPVYHGVCPWCGDRFQKSRLDQIFCLTEHKRAFHSQRDSRANALYDAALAWRKSRAKGGFTKFCRLIDDDLAADRERLAAYAKARKAVERDKAARNTARGKIAKSRKS